MLSHSLFDNMARNRPLTFAVADVARGTGGFFLHQQLLWPVTITVVNADLQNAPHVPSGVEVRTSTELPDTFPWDWYPRNIPHYGLAGAVQEAPRIWFAGLPEAQERGAFETLITAIGRRQRLLSTVTEAAMEGMNWPLAVAVLTTPA